MRINVTLSRRLKERLGHLAVGGLLALVFWMTYGCGDEPSREERTQEPGVGRVTPHMPARPVVSAPEPVMEPETVVPREVTFAEAEAAYRAREYGEAVTLFEAYTEQRPDDVWGQYMRGLSAWKAGEHEQAEEAFALALERNPEHVKSLINLSRVLLDTGRPEEAIGRIQQAMLIDGESSDALRLLGRARYQMRLVEEAIDAYWEAIVLDDEDVWSMNNLGFVLIEEGRFEEALPPLARATALRAEVAAFQNNLGIALERTGHFTTAADAYRAAVRADSTHEKAAVNLARVETLADDPETGVVDLDALALEFIDEVTRIREPVRAAVPETPLETPFPADSMQHPTEPTPQPDDTPRPE